MFRDSASLQDIQKAGMNILAFADGLTAEDIAVDEMRFSAILYQLR